MDIKRQQSIDSLNSMVTYEERTKDSTSSFVDTLNHSLVEREIDFILKERNKIRLFSPKFVYLYRHVSISWLASIAHVISLTISSLFIWMAIIAVYRSYTVEIEELGAVLDLTLFHYIIFAVVILTVYSSLHYLFNRPIGFQYKLAMFANSTNVAVLNTIKLFFIIVFLYLVLSDLNSSKKTIVTDYLYSSFYLFLIVGVIFERAFHFCKKEI